MISSVAPHPAGALVQWNVVPNSSRAKVAGIPGDALKVSVTAAPAAGKANGAVVKLLEQTSAASFGNHPRIFDAAEGSGHCG